MKMTWTADQIEYQTFLATPSPKRLKAWGMRTKTEFVTKHLKRARTTCWKWEQLPGFMEAVSQLARTHSNDKIADLYDSIFYKAIGDPNKPGSGNVAAQRLAVEIAHDMLNKQTVQNIEKRETMEKLTDEVINAKLNELLEKAKIDLIDVERD